MCSSINRPPSTLATSAIPASAPSAGPGRSYESGARQDRLYSRCMAYMRCLACPAPFSLGLEHLLGVLPRAQEKKQERKAVEKAAREAASEAKRAEAAAKLAAMSEDERVAWKAKRNALLQQRRDEHAAKRERLEKVTTYERCTAFCRHRCEITAGPSVICGWKAANSVASALMRSMWWSARPWRRLVVASCNT